MDVVLALSNVLHWQLLLLVTKAGAAMAVLASCRNHRLLDRVTLRYLHLLLQPQPFPGSLPAASPLE